MSSRKFLGALAIAVGLCSQAVAGPFEDGVAAARRGDFATAQQLWRPLAEQGNTAAENNLGLMYYGGDGVKQDFAEALKWFRLAADHGDYRAQANLGQMYRIAQGVALD